MTTRFPPHSGGMIEQTFLMRPATRWYGAIAVQGLVFGVAISCAPAVRPVPAPTPPPVPPVVVVVPPVVSSWTLPSVVPATRYLSSVVATLERDSSGRALREQLESRAFISLQYRRDSAGAIRGSGQIDSFTVRGLELALAPDNGTGGAIIPLAPSAPLSVAFDAVLEENEIRVTIKPPLVNECDRPESGAASLVRELLVRLPRTLQVGTTWSDSTVNFLCRVGVPITSHTRGQHVVERAEQVDGRTELVVRRTSDMQLDGGLRTAWRTVTVGGNGTATQIIRVDAGTGLVRSVDGEGVLTVRLSDSARREEVAVQEVRQATKSRIVVVP